MSSDSVFKPVPTRAALALQNRNKQSEFQVTVFEEPKSYQGTEDGPPERKLPRKRATETTEKQSKDDLEFDIKKARNEVLNFAMNNQRNIKNKKKMQIFKAIKLGAKPPKKPYKNYKELLDERKRLKNIREERKKFHELGKNQAGAASVKCKSKTKLERQQKKRAPVSSIAQHYGVVNPKLKKKK